MAKLLTDLSDLESAMKAKNMALKSVQPISGDETFHLITSRYSSNQKVDASVAKEYIEKHDKNLKKIALNTASTTLYVSTLTNKN